jgi:hypothetical protein
MGFVARLMGLRRFPLETDVMLFALSNFSVEMLTSVQEVEMVRARSWVVAALVNLNLRE